MGKLSNAWHAIDGWKTVLGYLPTQIFSDSNVVTAWTDLGHAAVEAVVTSNPTALIRPGLVAAGQTLLAIGVVHRVAKQLS